MSIRYLSPLALASLSLLASGCREGNADEPRPFEGVDISGIEAPWVEPDWSGVEVVGRAGAGYPGAPLLSLKEEWRVATGTHRTGPGDFGAERILIDSEENLYVKLISGEIHLYSPDGDFIREILGAVRIRPYGRSLIAVDPALVLYGPGGYEASFVDDQGRPIDSFSTAPLTLRTLVAGGGVFTRYENLFRRPEEAGVISRKIRIYWIPDSGEERMTAIADAEGQRSMCPGMGLGCSSIYWAPTGTFTVDASGDVYVHSGLPYRIDVYDQRGNPIRRIERNHTPVPTIEALVKSDSARAIAMIDRLQELTTLSDTLGALGGMLVSREGTLLVHRNDLIEGPVESISLPTPYWDLFSPEGAFLGTIRPPENFYALAVTDRAVIGRFIGPSESDDRTKYLLSLTWEP